jgi:hypothetical protein
MGSGEPEGFWEFEFRLEEVHFCSYKGCRELSVLGFRKLHVNKGANVTFQALWSISSLLKLLYLAITVF